MNTEVVVSDVAEQNQENAKRKRVMSDKQLKALEEGRKKRWLSKQAVKEEPVTSTSEEEDSSTEADTSESEETKTETETETEPPTETDPSTADESGDTSTSSKTESKSEQTETSEDEEDSEDSEPPSPPVLKRQKAIYKQAKNERAAAKMLKYIQAKTNPYFSHMYV